MDSISPRPQQKSNINNNQKAAWVVVPEGVQSPKPMTRSEPTNPYPTTFVQADTSSFKQVVQMLTGSSETAKQASSSSSKPTNPIPPMKSTPNKKQQHFAKLYERRTNTLNKNLNINPLTSFLSHNNTPPSPSILDFPALVLSPVTPLIADPFDRSIEVDEEDKAIKDKGFFFHPSPSSTPRDAEPRLLPLFPTTSPRSSHSGSRINQNIAIPQPDFHNSLIKR